jgi:hypothetical protein
VLRFYGTLLKKILPMRKIATFSDLILLACNEIPPSDQLSLKEETQFNLGLNKIFEDIVFLKKLIDDNTSEPSDESIDRILDYSRAVNYLKIPDPIGDTFLIAN